MTGEPVVARRRVEATATYPAQRRGGEGQPAPKAEPDSTDLATALSHAEQVGVSGLNVGDGGGEVELLHHRERVGHPRLVLTLETGLDPPEHVRRQHDVAGVCHSLGERPDVVIDPEELLKEQHPWPAAPGHSAEGVKRAGVGGRDLLVSGRHIELASEMAGSGVSVPERATCGRS